MSTLSRPERPATPHRGSSPTALLIVGHPGHELRVHAWLEMARPMVCVLTDGSGQRGEGRLESTTRVLARTGARPGPIYGRMTDRALYEAILDGNVDLFCRLANELSDTIVAQGATCVLGDAAEGYNPCHDVCRLVINAATRMASRVRGVAIENLDFAVVGAPDTAPSVRRDGSVHLALSDHALARKLETASGYPEMAGEVASALERFGLAPFQHEVLRTVEPDDRLAWTSADKPFYEQHGERRVAEGAYDRVLRFREHVVPVAEALWSYSTNYGTHGH